MAIMSSLDFWEPIFIIAAVAVAVRGRFRARAFLITAALILSINDGLVANSLKHAVHRLRPFQAVDGVRQIDLAKAKPRIAAIARPLKVTIPGPVADTGQGRSFPSGHVMDTMTIALLAFLFYPAWGWAAFLVPLVVGYSRIYVGSHYPSDVVISLFLGAGSTLFLACLAEYAWRRSGQRLLPRLHARHPALFAAV